MAYRGFVAEIALGYDGLTGTRNLSRVQPGQLLRALNLTYESGTLRKEGGTQKLTPSPLGSPILGGFDWHPADDVHRTVALLGVGTLRKDSGDGTFSTTLASGLTVNGVVPVFVECGREAAALPRKLAIFTGKNQLKILSGDGLTVANVATPPADWTSGLFPICGVNHEARLWGFAGDNAYYSQPDNHESFSGTGSGVIPVYPGEGGGRIVGAASFKGLIVVWKHSGIYIIDTSDPTVANWRVTRLNATGTLASPRAWVIIDDDLLFADREAEIHAISAVTEFGSLRNSSLSAAAQMLEWVRQNTNPAGYPKIQAVWYEAKREVHFCMAAAGSVVNDLRLVIDFNRPDRFRFRHSVMGGVESIWLDTHDVGAAQLRAGDASGDVWRLDHEGRTHNGAGYLAEWQTPHVDAGVLLGDARLASRRMNGQFLELVVEPRGNWNLAIDVYWDGAFHQTVMFNMGAAGTALGDFVLDTDALSGDAVLNRKRRITGSGRRISLVGRNNGAGQDFSVAKVLLHGVLGDERLRSDE